MTEFDVVVLGGGIVGIWTAMQAHSAGLRVAIVEIGPKSLADQTDSKPALEFTARRNLGATRARNHVLTGNSAYWGGGLIPNPPSQLQAMLGGEAARDLAGAVVQQHQVVERKLGIAPLKALDRLDATPLDVAEIVVLPSRRRALWFGFAQAREVSDGGLVCLTGTTIRDVQCEDDGRLRHVVVEDRDGVRHELRAPNFVLSMGVIDSNLFVLRFLLDKLPASARDIAGTCLHDHWSIPVARIRWRNGTPASRLYPPKFGRGGVIGRRLTHQHGFFHLLTDLDALPPYDRVKKFLVARQRGETFIESARAGLAALGRPLLMARAGVQYLARRELFVRDGTDVTLQLDFESSPSALNRIRWEGDRALLDWKARAGDVERFSDTCRSHRESLASFFGEAGLEVDWLVPTEPEARGEYFRENAIDAYHMGGGLHSHPDQAGVTNVGGRLKGVRNVHVLGTATFAQPGIANPVLTLLSLANVWVERLMRGEVSS